MTSHKLTGMAREVAEKYKETLVTLTFNNKIVINTLTEIAKEDTKYASVIVATIEERLRKAASDQLLPLMYLIDSICKNHGSPYKELFQHGLVSNFAFIFQQVSEKVKLPSSLLKSWFWI
jgi:pre-mRNA cleavage complex 2 protein Pcf11